VVAPGSGNQWIRIAVLSKDVSVQSLAIPATRVAVIVGFDAGGTHGAGTVVGGTDEAGEVVGGVEVDGVDDFEDDEHAVRTTTIASTKSSCRRCTAAPPSRPNPGIYRYVAVRGLRSR
jgi:hypothetical protein